MQSSFIRDTRTVLEISGFKGPLWEGILVYEKKTLPCLNCNGRNRIAEHRVACGDFAGCGSFSRWRSRLDWRRAWWRLLYENPKKDGYVKLEASKTNNSRRHLIEYIEPEDEDAKAVPKYGYTLFCHGCSNSFSEGLKFDKYFFCSLKCLELGPLDRM